MEEQQEKTKKHWYDKNYKIMLAIPLVLLLVCVGYFFSFNYANGDIIYKDVSLTGGTTVTVLDKNADIEIIKDSLKEEFPDLLIRQISDFRSGGQQGFFVETSAEPEIVKEALEESLGYELNEENSSTEFSGAALSQGFYEQLRLAIIIAFVLMAAVVFFIFRSFVPSGAVILSAFSDIVMTVAVVDLIGMRLSIAGIIAFLMLIGYSVDTDILLTYRILKEREGSVNSRLKEALKTGATMTLTSIAAISVVLIVIYNFSDTLRQIFTILLIGLGFDLFNTWFANAAILKWHAERKEARI